MARKVFNSFSGLGNQAKDIPDDRVKYYYYEDNNKGNNYEMD